MIGAAMIPEPDVIVFIKIVAKVSERKEIVAKYFADNALQFVFIGKGDEIKKIGQKYAPVTEVQINDDIGKGW